MRTVVALAWVIASSVSGCVPHRAPVRALAAPQAETPPDGAFRLAVEILWGDGELEAPEALATEDALAAMDLLAGTLGDSHDAVAAFVLGPSAWRTATDRALARQVH